MPDSSFFFLSYSSVDAKDVAVRLADTLAAGPPPLPVWLDKRKLQAGAAWDTQLVEAIRGCRGLLFVMTHDSVQDTSVCKREWIRALKYKKPVIPLLFDPDAELPFQLEPRQYIDFTGSFDTAMAQLRQHLMWMDSPEGVLQALGERLEEAERELPRAADATRRARIEQEIDELRRQLGEQQRLVEDPKTASEQTEQRIASGLERERQPERPVAVRRAKFVNPPPMVAPSWWQDRHVETRLIGDFLKDDGLRLLTVVGRGGIGKTAMVCRLLRALEGGQLPDNLGSLAVDGLVYLSPSGGRPPSFPNLFADLGRLVPDEVAERLTQQYRDPQQSPQALMRAVLQAFPGGRSVVLMDNFEDVVDPQTFVVSDAALEEALQTVLSAPPHGVKVILTTRLAPQKLALMQPALQRHLNLDEGLESPFAENILRELDADGTLGLKTAPDALLVAARERTRGVPRALEALVASLAADRNTSLPELLAETGTLLPENVVEVLVGEAFNRLDPLAQQVMQALAIYGRPVPPVAVDYLLQPYLVAVDSAPVLARLVNMQFTRRDAGHYYLHQVDRDYALSRLPQGQPSDRDALERPFTRYALLARGAEFFEETRTPRESWKHLEDLAAQRAEFELRYQAEDYDNAASVLLDIDFDYLLVWGHYRLVVELHERLRGKVSDPDLEQASTGNLGTALYRMGRYRQAIQRYEEALALARQGENRRGESAWLGWLGNCYGDLGELRRAIDLHEQALGIAREIGYRQAEAHHLGNLGGCYADLGELRRAIDLYGQALAIFREIGDRQGEAAHLGNLGGCYFSLGELQRAIELYEQAVGIAREIGYRQSEASQLGNLGLCYADLGELRRAIELHEQALGIAREIGDPQGEAYQLINLGDCDTRREVWEQAIQRYDKAIRIADEIGAVQAQSAGRASLAMVQLFQGALAAAREAALDGRTYDYAPNAAGLSVILGVVLLREGATEPARVAFSEAVGQADALLAQTSDNYRALDTKALALCGLVLLGESARVPEATAAMQAARAISRAAGVVADAMRLFDALAVADHDGLLGSVRAVATALPEGHSDST